MRYLLMLLCCALAALGQTPPPPASGLHVVSLEDGTSANLGRYANPSVDPQGKWLYADDTRGNIVRWRLDALGAAPTVFAAAPKGEPGYRFPVCAPAGGLVAAFQAYAAKGPNGADLRVAVSFLDNSGRRIAGGLPLFYAKGRYNGARAIAWHPAGELVAFYLTVGNSGPGLYVFRPSTKYWQQAHSLTGGEGSADGRVQWSTDGRTLSEGTPEGLVLRGGSDYAKYRTLDNPFVAHTWQDMDTLLLHTDAGLMQTAVDGGKLGTIPGWPGTDVANAGLASASASGLMWLRVAGTGAKTGVLRYALHYVPSGKAAGSDVFSFDGNAGYTRGLAEPVWLPGKRAAVVTVP
ncbi:MAG: hypothetical protein HZB16_03560 [Armatimonadetes bacterium]|nr:hypothetical protein [Armatimonadota bacterium]